METGQKENTTQAFLPFFFGFKNCVEPFRIKFCTRKSNLFFKKIVSVVPRKSAKLEKMVWKLKRATFVTKRLKTGIWWDQTLCIFKTLRIVAPAEARLDFDSDPLTLHYALFSPENAQKVRKVILFFIWREEKLRGWGWQI